MKAEKEGSESNAENTRQSATTFSNNKKIYKLSYQRSDQYKKKLVKFITNLKARRDHLIISLGIKNREQNLRNNVFKVVYIVENMNTQQRKSLCIKTSAIIHLTLYENSATYGRRVIISVIANTSIEITKGNINK